MDVASLVAIDIHTHVHRSISAPGAKEDDAHLAAMGKYFKTDAVAFTVEEVLAVTGMTVDVAAEVGVMQENLL